MNKSGSSLGEKEKVIGLNESSQNSSLTNNPMLQADDLSRNSFEIQSHSGHAINSGINELSTSMRVTDSNRDSMNSVLPTTRKSLAASLIVDTRKSLRAVDEEIDEQSLLVSLLQYPRVILLFQLLTLVYYRTTDSWYWKGFVALHFFCCRVGLAVSGCFICELIVQCFISYNATQQSVFLYEAYYYVVELLQIICLFPAIYYCKLRLSEPASKAAVPEFDGFVLIGYAFLAIVLPFNMVIVAWCLCSHSELALTYAVPFCIYTSLLMTGAMIFILVDLKICYHRIQSLLVLAKMGKVRLQNLALVHHDVHRLWLGSCYINSAMVLVAVLNVIAMFIIVFALNGDAVLLTSDTSYPTFLAVGRVLLFVKEILFLAIIFYKSTDVHDLSDELLKLLALSAWKQQPGEGDEEGAVGGYDGYDDDEDLEEGKRKKQQQPGNSQIDDSKEGERGNEDLEEGAVETKAATATMAKVKAKAVSISSPPAALTAAAQPPLAAFPAGKARASSSASSLARLPVSHRVKSHNSSINSNMSSSIVSSSMASSSPSKRKVRRSQRHLVQENFVCEIPSVTRLALYISIHQQPLTFPLLGISYSKRTFLIQLGLLLFTLAGGFIKAIVQL